MDSAKQLGLFLGLKRDKVSPFDIIDLARKGVKASLVKKLLQEVHLNQDEFATFLGFKKRTLSRRFENANELLNPEETEKVIRFARVFVETLDVFQDEEKAALWLKRTNKALNNNMPISLLDSEFGAEQVLEVLGRIRDGVYS